MAQLTLPIGSRGAAQGHKRSGQGGARWRSQRWIYCCMRISYAHFHSMRMLQLRTEIMTPTWFDCKAPSTQSTAAFKQSIQVSAIFDSEQERHNANIGPLPLEWQLGVIRFPETRSKQSSAPLWHWASTKLVCELPHWTSASCGMSSTAANTSRLSDAGSA